MKNLISIAVGAAIAGALVTLLMKRRAGNVAENSFDEAADTVGRDVLGRGTGSGFTVEELISDSPVGRTLNS